MPDLYWFAVTVRFLCPACQRTSAELMVISSPVMDPKTINKSINKQKLECQLCKVPLINGIEVAVNVQQATPEQLKNRGFQVPPDK